jgi:hypothetical protein
MVLFRPLEHGLGAGVFTAVGGADRESEFLQFFSTGGGGDENREFR